MNKKSDVIEFSNGSKYRGCIKLCELCGEEMNTVGLGDCNGWRCPACGHEDADIVSFKLNNEY